MMSKPKNEEEAKKRILDWCKENGVHCCWCYPPYSDKIVRLEIKKGLTKIYRRFNKSELKSMKYVELFNVLKKGLKKIEAIEEAIESEKGEIANV